MTSRAALHPTLKFRKTEPWRNKFGAQSTTGFYLSKVSGGRLEMGFIRGQQELQQPGEVLSYTVEIFDRDRLPFETTLITLLSLQSKKFTSVKAAQAAVEAFFQNGLAPQAKETSP